MSENIHKDCENYNSKRDYCLKFFEDNVSEKYTVCKEYSELSDKETEYMRLKEQYNQKEFEIVYLSDINFKELYGSTSEKVRKQHASKVLKSLKDELNGLELSIDYLKRYTVFIRELIRTKRVLMEVKE